MHDQPCSADLMWSDTQKKVWCRLRRMRGRIRSANEFVVRFATGHPPRLLLDDACYAIIAAYNTHPLVAGRPCNPLFNKSSKPFVWAPESSE